MPKISVWGLLVLLLVSCNADVVVGEMKSLTGGWDQKEEIVFTIPPLDSLTTYNVFLHLRNTNEYPYNNIFLIASMQFPHGKTITDTLEYRMAAPDGSWLGTGLGPVKESKLWFKEGVRFFEDGNYTLKVSQAVRNNGEAGGVSQLKGITEVGYSIEKVPE
ncbi:MAG TPA: gliding motility lipoprotein GldH [Flavobacteriaceae bacterium]|nr:gliding motility lipoprotein GldH [Flavobacteriaceae bacterium]MCB9212028.1 gliding motility lipoprotein GldH [Alteromonas sp.]HPF09877.1 gliding motility lipoprotein GldH [Flavobacteriaceae bacterium]HQU19974.1 gliding motility lipoprotein GldH [Flavobacteriaceae bacterium]HQU64040.1 gliding motility lipoprotein GldH [Flavobacteriaceae bacterium]